MFFFHENRGPNGKSKGENLHDVLICFDCFGNFSSLPAVPVIPCAGAPVSLGSSKQLLLNQSLFFRGQLL